MSVGTKPTAGKPYHPVEVTRVTFETNAGPNAEPAEQYAAAVLARTVRHLEKVDVGAIVSAYLEEMDRWIDPAALKDFDDECLGTEILRITALVETVLDHARATVRTRMAADLATTLIPRLKGHRSV